MTTSAPSSALRRERSASSALAAEPPREPPGELTLVLGAVALGFIAVALLTHSAQDPAWSTSGVAAEAVHNWAVFQRSSST